MTWFDKLTTNASGSRLPPTTSETTPTPFILSLAKDGYASTSKLFNRVLYNNHGGTRPKWLY